MAEPPSLTYIAGRIYLDTNSRWVYESYNHTFTSDKFPDLYEALTTIHRTSEEELKYQKDSIEQIKTKLIELHEERRQAAILAAQKKKGASKKLSMAIQ